jgi:hypothetical protein
MSVLLWEDKGNERMNRWMDGWMDVCMYNMYNSTMGSIHSADLGI